MISDWIIFAAAGGIASNIFNFFTRVFLRDNDDSTAYAWFFESFRGIFYLFVAFFDYHLLLDPKTLTLFVLLGLTEFISVFFYMKMHAYSQLSISSIVSRSRMIWIPIFGILLFGEKLKSIEYFGIFVLFVGLSIAISPKKFFLDRGAINANIAAMFIALNIIVLKSLTPYGSASVLMVALSLPSFFLFPLVMKNPKQRIIKTLTTNLLLKLLAFTFNLAATYFLVIALQKGPASVVNALYQGMLIISVIAGILLLKEKENVFKKLLGATITIVGLILLVY